MSAGRSSARRWRGFPSQFASLEAPLGAFVAAAFGGTRLDPAPMLRGVYFTSGTQEGSPLDRLAGAMSRSFGFDPRRPAAVMQQKGRAYFITKLLKDVVFNEARLASNDRKADKRRRIVAATAWSLAALVVAGGGFYGYSAWSAEQARAQRLAGQIGKAEQAAQGVPFDVVTDAEFRRVLPYLDAARDLPPAASGDGPAFGLDQGDKLEAGANAAYRRALDRSFLPRLLARMELVMRGAFQRPDELYDVTRAYLMLGQEGPLDIETVKNWFARDWLRAFPGAVNQPIRDALMAHLDATLARNFQRYPVDGALVDQARRVFSRLPLAQRVFSRLQNVAATAAQNIQPWRPADALGQAGAAVLRARLRPAADRGHRGPLHRRRAVSRVAAGARRRGAAGCCRILGARARGRRSRHGRSGSARAGGAEALCRGVCEAVAGDARGPEPRAAAAGPCPAGGGAEHPWRAQLTHQGPTARHRTAGECRHAAAGLDAPRRAAASGAGGGPACPAAGADGAEPVAEVVEPRFEGDPHRRRPAAG
jgi:hypothetical protein